MDSGGRMRSRRYALRWTTQAALIGFFLAVGAAAPLLEESVFAQSSPLPNAGAISVAPVVFFVLDTSGSETANDGGCYDPGAPPVPATLYNPLTDAATGGDQGTGCSGSGSLHYLNRLQAIKLAMASILDANHDGVINTADEQVLGAKIGLTRYGDSGYGGTAATFPLTAGITTAQVQTLADTYKASLNNTDYKPVGSSFLDVWIGVKGIGFSSVGTPHGPALAGGRA